MMGVYTYGGIYNSMQSASIKLLWYITIIIDALEYTQSHNVLKHVMKEGTCIYVCLY